MRAAVRRLHPQVEAIAAVAESKIRILGNEARHHHALRSHVPVVSLCLQLGEIRIEAETLQPAGKKYQLLLIADFESLYFRRAAVPCGGQTIPSVRAIEAVVRSRTDDLAVVGEDVVGDIFSEK